MEQERARAAELGYEDPICVNFEATTALYNTVLDKVRTIPIKSYSKMFTSTYQFDCFFRKFSANRWPS